MIQQNPTVSSSWTKAWEANNAIYRVCILPSSETSSLEAPALLTTECQDLFHNKHSTCVTPMRCFHQTLLETGVLLLSSSCILSFKFQAWFDTKHINSLLVTAVIPGISPHTVPHLRFTHESLVKSQCLVNPIYPKVNQRRQRIFLGFPSFIHG